MPQPCGHKWLPPIHGVMILGISFITSPWFDAKPLLCLVVLASTAGILGMVFNEEALQGLPSAVGGVTPSCAWLFSDCGG